MSGRTCPECGVAIAHNARSCACGWGEKKTHAAEIDHGCAAYGCPMAGSMSSGTTGQGPWFCFLHFGAHPSRRDAITARIRQHEWMVRLAERSLHVDPSVWVKSRNAAVSYCTSKGRADLAPEIRESQSRYFSRLRQALAELCREPKAAADADDAAGQSAPSSLLTDFLAEVA